MSTTIETLENRRVKITVEVEAQRLNEAKQKAARKLAKDVKIPGFRPGKAPAAMVEKYVGSARILEEAAEELLGPVLDEAVKANELEVYSYHHVDVEIANIDPLTFTYVVPLTPQVTLGDVSLLSVEPDEPTIDETDVDKSLEELRRSRGEWAPSLGPVDKDDRATLDLRGDLMDGTSVRDDKGVDRLITIVEDKPDDVMSNLLELPEGVAEADDEADTDEDGGEEASGYDAESEINKNLLGMIVNSTKEFPLTYPSDYSEERLRGRTVLYRATLLDLKKRQYPELDDEFAQSVGEFETVEALRDRVRENLQASAVVREFDKTVEEILTQLVDESEIVYPRAVIDHEIEHRVENFAAQLRNYGITLDSYLQTMGRTREEMGEEFREQAEQAIRRSLVITEYVRARDIKVEGADLQAELMTLVNESGGDPNELMKELQSNQEAVMGLVNRVAGRKGIFALYEEVTGLDVPAEVKQEFETPVLEEGELVDEDDDETSYDDPIGDDYGDDEDDEDDDEDDDDGDNDEDDDDEEDDDEEDDEDDDDEEDNEDDEDDNELTEVEVEEATLTDAETGGQVSETPVEETNAAVDGGTTDTVPDSLDATDETAQR